MSLYMDRLKDAFTALDAAESERRTRAEELASEVLRTLAEELGIEAAAVSVVPPDQAEESNDPRAYTLATALEAKEAVFRVALHFEVAAHDVLLLLRLEHESEAWTAQLSDGSRRSTKIHDWARSIVQNALNELAKGIEYRTIGVKKGNEHSGMIRVPSRRR